MIPINLQVVFRLIGASTRSSKTHLCMYLLRVLNVDSADTRQWCIWCLRVCLFHPNDQIMSMSEVSDLTGGHMSHHRVIASLSPKDTKHKICCIQPPPWGTCRWFIVWQCLSFCFSTETICYHILQQAHSGADGLSDRVSNDTGVRWIWTPCVNIIAHKQLHESRMREIIVVVHILKMDLFAFGFKSGNSKCFLYY